MVILAQDPSFNALAFSLYDGESTVYIDNSTYSLGDNIGFNKVFIASLDLWNQYHGKLDSLGVGKSLFVNTLVSEIPPPVGMFSAGLYGLDTYIISQLYYTYGIDRVFTLSPSYLSTIHGTSKYKKSDSTKLAKYFINEVLVNDIKIVIPDNVTSKRRTKGQINNDRAESFLFLLRMFAKYDVLGLRNKIVSEMSGFGYEAENPLIP